MRTVTISDDLFEQLKSFVVDPFDDTPDLVIGRLISIVNKAKSRWSPLEDREASSDPQGAPSKPQEASNEPQEAPNELPHSSNPRSLNFDDLPQEEDPVVVL
ncbi:MAG: hypothetical protein JSW27_18935 [Phycisphaerales bacterium]|nr:MAG: hypothetical protein JSW27_18935 [Phycisphaerales bacterium]